MSFFKDFKNDLSQVVGNSDQATSDAASAVAMAEEVNTVSDQIDTLVLDDFEKDSRQEVIPEMVSEPIMAEAPIEELAINDISMEEQVTVIPEITPVAETPAEPVAAEMPIAEPVIEAAPIVEPVIEAAPIVEPIAEPVIEWRQQ